ncbi:MAG TPA: class IV adenylate cyclase [Dehalococcoidia bacterium]|nr:class IV adenylate cyclase [Dehalococcoidia bacterium]
MRNLEFKARAPDPRSLETKARALGADLWGNLRQTDTYFRVRRGRLKLRETAGFQAELVYYERDEAGAPMASDYRLVRTQDGEALREALTAALGVLAVVRKRRTLLLLDSTRLHLDNVEGLGSFFEIEVPVRDGEQAAQAEIDRLLAAFGLDWNACLRASYLDLALQAREPQAGTLGE